MIFTNNVCDYKIRSTWQCLQCERWHHSWIDLDKRKIAVKISTNISQDIRFLVRKLYFQHYQRNSLTNSIMTSIFLPWNIKPLSLFHHIHFYINSSFRIQHSKGQMGVSKASHQPQALNTSNTRPNKTKWHPHHRNQYTLSLLH